MRRSVAWMFLMVASFVGTSVSPRADETTATADFVARDLSAVVSISSVKLRQPDGNGLGVTTSASASGTPGKTNEVAKASAEQHLPSRVRTFGSGFIIDPSGIIVTNRHVIEGAADILVTMQDNTLLRATVLAAADELDLALLKVTPDSPLPSVRFGDSDRLRVADQVFAIGDPLGFGGSVTRGIVSALNRDISDTPFDDYIQTDAAINHGNSGGPLFNMQGEVIGMNTAIFAPAASGSIGLGFAIPSNELKFVSDALRNGSGTRLGSLDFRIQQITPGIADALNMPRAEGAIVAGTKEGGGAAKCGIVSGDIILRFGTLGVKDVRALARAIAQTPPKTVVRLLVWRNEEPTVIMATVQELQHKTPSPAPEIASGNIDPGWSLASILNDERRVLRLAPDLTGVLVTQIAPDSAAAEAGLSPRDVIIKVQQDKVTAPDDVDRLVSLARQQQRSYVAVLVRNTDGLR